MKLVILDSSFTSETSMLHMHVPCYALLIHAGSCHTRRWTSTSITQTCALISTWQYVACCCRCGMCTGRSGTSKIGWQTSSDTGATAAILAYHQVFWLACHDHGHAAVHVSACLHWAVRPHQQQIFLCDSSLLLCAAQQTRCPVAVVRTYPEAIHEVQVSITD